MAMTFELIGKNVAEKKQEEVQKREAAVNTEREQILEANNQKALERDRFDSESVYVKIALESFPLSENREFLRSNGFEIYYVNTTYVVEGYVDIK